MFWFIYLLLEIFINVHTDIRMTFDRNIELELLRKNIPWTFQHTSVFYKTVANPAGLMF